MNKVSYLTALILIGLLSAATPVAAKDDPLEKASKSVQQVVKAYIDQSLVGGWVFRTLEIKIGKEKIYTVDLVGRNGKKKSLSLTPSGKILKDVIRPAEKTIPLKEAPEGLRSTLEVLRGERKVKTVAELARRVQVARTQRLQDHPDRQGWEKIHLPNLQSGQGFDEP